MELKNILRGILLDNPGLQLSEEHINGVVEKVAPRLEAPFLPHLLSQGCETHTFG
jgi:hypothetical protein